MTSARTARTVALLLTALVVSLTVRYNTYAAWATDSGAYISAGQAWARGEVFAPATFVFWAPWAASGQVEFPLGHVQGPIKGTITGQYPLGYPLLIAAALKITGDPLSAHLVSPVFAGVLVWCAFLLGRQMGGPWAGVLSALIIGATPIVLGHTVMPFSDVPAAAFWALAWAMSIRPGLGAASASGAAAAMAVTIRPNLAPLAVVIAAAVTFAQREGAWRGLARLVTFGLFGAIGPLIVLWSQAELYGNPMQSGYRVPMDHFFSMERVPFNAGLYPRMLGELHSWLPFAGLLYAPFAIRGMRKSPDAYSRGVLALSALGLVLVNYALYLPYLTYVGWYWLRFLLPGLLAMFVLFAAASSHLGRLIEIRWPRFAFVAALPAIFVAWSAEEHIRPPVGYERMQMMERYLPSVLPDNAVILTYAHGGAMAAATGRPILRVDYIEGPALDGVIQDLQRRGMRPVYVFDAAIDGDFFGNRFRATHWGRLTWPARAEMTSVTSILLYDLQDRELFASGDRWMTDVLVDGRSVTANVHWSEMRGEHERIILPLPEETQSFRTLLDVVYRDRLGRAMAPAPVDPGESLRWLRRYVRLRLHGCSHDVASERIWRQLETGRAAPLCARPDEVRFPPENETADFRTQLGARLRTTPGRPAETSVDPLGEVVWLQRYLDARIRGCSDRQAVQAVVTQIVGEQSPRCVE